MAPDRLPPPGPPTRDSFLDAIKAIAIVRVIAWHTWSWWWLSWFAAMPAMFFVSGALLDGSLERRGPAATIRSRLRRLLPPFWVYGAFAVTVMLVAGWRPTVADLARWVLPLGDPSGSMETPGLWIPLWYLRAYLWVLLAAPVLSWGTRRLGAWVLVVPVAATFGFWVAQERGWTAPLAVTDFATFVFFVLVGMLYHRVGTTPPRAAATVGVVAGGLALAWWVGFGPASGVVNESYPLQLLSGVALLGFLVAARAPLAGLHGRAERCVRYLGSRALTIYLWQGFGLVAADQLVTRQDIDGVAGVVASGVVVGVVTATCVAAFGWVEDVAAGRPARLPHIHMLPVATAATACLVLATVVAPAPGTSARLPPSGQAVVARAGLVEDDLAGEATTTTVSAADSASTAERLQATIDGWAGRNAAVLDGLGTKWVDATIVTPSGDPISVQWTRDGGAPALELVPWWSMTKTLTAAWLASLVDRGTVALDDPLADHLAWIPGADRMTLEDLARHRSGMPSEPSGFIADGPRAELERWFADPVFAFESGSGFAYSRLGYHLLAWALEEASGTSWEEAVATFETMAGVDLVVDAEVDPLPEVSHPGDGTYDGRLWAAGGVLATHEDTARFFQWLMGEGLSPEARDLMTRFGADATTWHYGLGLVPLCPCELDGEWLTSGRYGLDALSGSWAFDAETTATVFLTADEWFDDDGPVVEFYDLESALLDAAG